MRIRAHGWAAGVSYGSRGIDARAGGIRSGWSSVCQTKAAVRGNLLALYCDCRGNPSCVGRRSSKSRLCVRVCRATRRLAPSSLRRRSVAASCCTPQPSPAPRGATRATIGLLQSDAGGYFSRAGPKSATLNCFWISLRRSCRFCARHAAPPSSCGVVALRVRVRQLRKVRTRAPGCRSFPEAS